MERHSGKKRVEGPQSYECHIGPSYFLSTLFSKRFLVFVRKKKRVWGWHERKREKKSKKEKEGRLKDTGDITY